MGYRDLYLFGYRIGELMGARAHNDKNQAASSLARKAFLKARASFSMERNVSSASAPHTSRLTALEAHTSIFIAHPPHPQSRQHRQPARDRRLAVPHGAGQL